jgi:predicted transcriptional regulator
MYHKLEYSDFMSRAISVRLDDDVLAALRTLEASGLSRSDAIRKSILDEVAAIRRREVLRSEVAALEADDADRRELADVAALMKSLRAEG